MSTEVATLSPVDRACRLIVKDEYKVKIKSALVGTSVSVEKFTRVSLTALQQNADIRNCEPDTLLLAVMQCAQAGLMPDGKQAAIVRFGNVAQFMPMIGGLRYIAAKHGIAMATGVVHKNDSFTYELGVESKMRHVPPPLDQPRGEPIGAWAQARDAKGEIHLEVMSRDDIERIRNISRAKGNGPWKDHWGEMARKTVGRRLFKSLPLGDLDERDQRVIDAADSEVDLTADPTPVATAQTAVNPDTGTRRPSGLQATLDRHSEGGMRAGEPAEEPEYVTQASDHADGPAHVAGADF